MKIQNLLEPIQIYTLSSDSITPSPIRVEVQSFFKIPRMVLIGLPSQEVLESRERIQSAFASSDIDFPKRKIVVNLTPSDQKKSGSGHDLGVALSILLHSHFQKRSHSKESSHSRAVTKILTWGELGLDGRVIDRGSSSRLAILAHQLEVDWVIFAKDQNHESLEKFFTAIQTLPNINLAWKDKFQILQVKNLRELKKWVSRPQANVKVPRNLLRDLRQSSELLAPPLLTNSISNLNPISPRLLKWLCASVLGKHHLLLLGPRGVGKSHALQWLRALWTPLQASERLDWMNLNELNDEHCPCPDPDFAITHFIPPQIRPAHLLGTMQAGKFVPGHLCRAHGGLLCADEFAEWPRDSREALRLPLEEQQLLIRHRAQTSSIPCRFTFAGTSNLCPCGGGSSEDPCRCTPSAKNQYWNRLSGPVLERIDLKVLMTLSPESKKPRVLDQINQFEEYHRKFTQLKERSSIGEPGRFNASQSESLIDQSSASSQQFVSSIDRSYRLRHKTFNVAMTLAWMEGFEYPNHSHLMESLACCQEPKESYHLMIN